MGTPHKHAELIKAWADGAEIQCRSPMQVKWEDIVNPVWASSYEYRIKPKTIKYRNYLSTDGFGSPNEVCVAYNLNAANGCRFIKWIGDWQEVEV